MTALDFKRAYLNAPLAGEIRLELPGGEVVHARKEIYGLRQNAMELWKEFRKNIVDAKWESIVHDQYMYYRRGSNGRIAVLMTYVDDLPLTVNNKEKIQRMMKYLWRSLGGGIWGTR